MSRNGLWQPVAYQMLFVCDIKLVFRCVQVPLVVKHRSSRPTGYVEREV